MDVCAGELAGLAVKHFDSRGSAGVEVTAENICAVRGNGKTAHYLLTVTEHSAGVGFGKVDAH